MLLRHEMCLDFGQVAFPGFFVITKYVRVFIKPVFHLNSNVKYRRILFCIIIVSLLLGKQRNALRCVIRYWLRVGNRLKRLKIGRRLSVASSTKICRCQ